MHFSCAQRYGIDKDDQVPCARSNELSRPTIREAADRYIRRFYALNPRLSDTPEIFVDDVLAELTEAVAEIKAFFGLERPANDVLTEEARQQLLAALDRIGA